jgi:YfiH family protein
MLSEADLIFPDWPAPANVRALQTTRPGGCSCGPYESLNLGDHVGDDPLVVAANRQRLSGFVPSEPVWMRQVHGAKAIDAALASCLPEADAAFANVPDTVCCVMTADCLPVLLCDRAGTVVAAVHAGWRGLLHGVIEAAIASMRVPASDLLAWLGPAIGPESFEVGDEVCDSFIALDKNARHAFAPHAESKWLVDIYLLARQRLQAAGLTQIHGGEFCTYTDSTRFFSYRRDGVTGRMATMIWLAQK